MKIPFLDLYAQYQTLAPQIQASMQRVIEDSSYILGKEVHLFEQEFGAFSGLKEVIGCSNGTDALVLGLRALDIGPGDEVITTPYTFVSTAEAIVECGAKVVFADISPEDCNLDLQRIKEKCSVRTKAIILVHLYGQPALQTEEICQFARERQLAVIEDCAQAHGARIHGQGVGTFGKLATFSFYPGKNLGAYGDAGAVGTKDENLAATIRLLRDHGRSEKYTHKILGYNCRMDGMQGAILRTKLPHLATWTKRRQEIADQYRQLLQKVPGVILPKRFDHALSVVHLFVIRHPKRDLMHRFLAEKGISTLIHYPLGLHLQPCFADLGHRTGDFPHTERLSQEVLSIPCYPELTEAQVQYIAKSIRDVAQEL